MEDLLSIISRVCQGILHEVTSFSLTGMLWIGLALLTFCLLVLMRTKWGHAKPVWKCMVLSVMAHILLGGYAYGTRLVMTIPIPEQDDPISLKVVRAPEASPESNSNRQSDVSKPWDHIDTENEQAPIVSQVGRIEATVQDQIERSKQATGHLITQQVPAANVNSTLEAQHPFVIETDSAAHVVGHGKLRAEKISVARPKKVDEGFESEPQVGILARMDDVTRPQEPQGPSIARPGPSTNVEDLVRDLAASAIMTPVTEKPSLVEVTDKRRAAVMPQPDAPQFDTPRRRLTDGQEVPQLYALRAPELRAEAASQLGGNSQTEQAVDAALAWLSTNQELDGRWSAQKFGGGQERLVLGHDRRGAGSNADTGVTALSLLAFLAAGHSHLEGQHRETVQRGLEFLLNTQHPNGSLAGDARLFAQMYCHAMASLALSEALALTGDSRLLRAVQRAVDYTVSAQNRFDGGWRYQAGDQGDMSQFGWQVMALKSARLGGANVPESTFDLMKRFLDRCTSGASGGLAGYRPGHPPSATMTAEALLCRFFLYEEVQPATLGEASEVLLGQLPGQSEENLYYWYYGTLAMFHGGGDAWERWNQNLSETLVESQVSSGSASGSWEPTGVWCGYGGRVYSTAMAALCLEVYYRYARR